MKVKRLWVAVIVLLTACIVNEGQAGSGAERPETKKGRDEVSFKSDVFPVMQKHCLPCHAEDNFNPSELSLDSYSDLMAGGKHGKPVIVGKAKESVLLQKLGEKPPFGERMPLNSKKKIQDGKATWLSKEELEVIMDWVNQGAKNN